MGGKLQIDIYIFDGQVQRNRCHKLDTYVYHQQIRCREIGTAVGCIRIGTENCRSTLIFSAMRSDKYNGLSLLSTGLVGISHFRSILISLIKYFSNRMQLNNRQGTQCSYYVCPPKCVRAQVPFRHESNIFQFCRKQPLHHSELFVTTKK